ISHFRRNISRPILWETEHLLVHPGTESILAVMIPGNRHQWFIAEYIPGIIKKLIPVITVQSGRYQVPGNLIKSNIRMFSKCFLCHLSEYRRVVRIPKPDE